MYTYILYILSLLHLENLSLSQSTILFFRIEQSRTAAISFFCPTFLFSRISWFLPRCLWIIQRNFLCIPEGNIWDKRSDRKTAQEKFFVSPFQHFKIFEPTDKCWKVNFSEESWQSTSTVQWKWRLIFFWISFALPPFNKQSVNTQCSSD